MRVLLGTTLLLYYSLFLGVDGQSGCPSSTSFSRREYDFEISYKDILKDEEKQIRGFNGKYCAPVDPPSRRRRDVGSGEGAVGSYALPDHGPTLTTRPTRFRRLREEKAEVPANEKCWSLMDAFGIDVFNFPYATAHRIHSLSLQDLRQFIDPDAPKTNGIPTINFDQTSDNVILNNTRDDPNLFAASGLRAFDSVLSHVKNLQYEIAKGSDKDKRVPLVITRLIHEFHMQDLWALMKPFYDKLVANPPENKQLCPCIKDIENNKVLAYLKWMSKGKALVGDVNAINKGKKVEMFDGNSIYALWSEERIKLQEFHEAKDGSYSAAIFLYCMLNE